MISEIQFKNFRALRDTVLPLSRFTLLVGPNGSGKSSVFRAIQYLNPAFHADLASEKSFGATDSVVEIIIPVVRGPNHDWGGRKSSAAGIRMIPELKTTLDHPLVLSLEPKAIAAPVRIEPNLNLGSDGRGLAGVLERIRDEYPEQFDSLNSALSEWLPEYDRILFRVPQAGAKEFLLRTKVGQHAVAPSNLSDGTLIALAILTLAYFPIQPGLICLEEPDRGLHPRLLQDVKNAILRLCYPEEFGEKREPVQVIATTHNPFFLDLFRDNPEQIVIAEKTGLETKFKRLSDHPNLNEIIAGVPLGEVWYSGVLGGVPAGT